MSAKKVVSKKTKSSKPAAKKSKSPTKSKPKANSVKKAVAVKSKKAPAKQNKKKPTVSKVKAAAKAKKPIKKVVPVSKKSMPKKNSPKKADTKAKKASKPAKTSPSPKAESKKNIVSAKKTVARKPEGQKKIKAAASPKKETKPAKVEKANHSKIVKEVAAKVKKKEDKKPKALEKTSHIYFSLEDALTYLKNPAANTNIVPKKTPATTRQQAISSSQKTKPAKLPVQKRKHGPASIADILGFNPFKNQKVVVEDNVDKVPKKWKKFYTNLINMRDKIEADINEHSQEYIGRSSREDSGDLTTNTSDAGTETFERDLAFSLFSNEKELLSEIELAIDRIMDGSYGVCEITGKPIDQERLEAIPYTRYSLEGQQQMERNKRSNIQRTNIFSEANEVEFQEEEE